MCVTEAGVEVQEDVVLCQPVPRDDARGRRGDGPESFRTPKRAPERAAYPRGGELCSRARAGMGGERVPAHPGDERLGLLGCLSQWPQRRFEQDQELDRATGRGELARHLHRHESSERVAEEPVRSRRVDPQQLAGVAAGDGGDGPIGEARGPGLGSCTPTA